VVHLVVAHVGVRASQLVHNINIVVVVEIGGMVSGDRGWPHCGWRSRSLSDSASRRCIDLAASQIVTRDSLRIIALLNVA